MKGKDTSNDKTPPFPKKTSKICPYCLGKGKYIGSSYLDPDMSCPRCDDTGKATYRVVFQAPDNKEEVVYVCHDPQEAEETREAFMDALYKDKISLSEKMSSFYAIILPDGSRKE
jgi:hypothetical protein